MKVIYDDYHNLLFWITIKHNKHFSMDEIKLHTALCSQRSSLSPPYLNHYLEHQYIQWHKFKIVTADPYQTAKQAKKKAFSTKIASKNTSEIFLPYMHIKHQKTLFYEKKLATTLHSTPGAHHCHFHKWNHDLEHPQIQFYKLKTVSTDPN